MFSTGAEAAIRFRVPPSSSWRPLFFTLCRAPRSRGRIRALPLRTTSFFGLICRGGTPPAVRCNSRRSIISRTSPTFSLTGPATNAAWPSLCTHSVLGFSKTLTVHSLASSALSHVVPLQIENCQSYWQICKIPLHEIYCLSLAPAYSNCRAVHGRFRFRRRW